MKKIFWTLGFTGFFAAATAQEKQYADKILAIVGNKVVLLSDIGRQHLGAEKDATTEIPEEAKCGMLRDAIAAKILIEQAARDSVMVTSEDVEGRLDYQMNNILYSGFGGDKAAMEKSMGKSIYQLKEEYRDIIKDNLTYQKMYEEVVKDVAITPKEVEDYFSKLPEEQKQNVPASVEVGEVVLKPDVDPEVEKYTKERVEDIRKQIADEGKSFETMAQIYSEDGGAENGGALNLNRKNGQYDNRFVAAAFKLQPGELSPVFRSSFGYHIIEMVERNGDDAKIRYIVVVPKQTSSDFDKTMVKLDSVRNDLIASKLTFTDAVTKVSNDESSKQSGGMIRDPRTGAAIVSMDNIKESDLALQVSELEVGEYSKPHIFVDEMDGSKKVRILYIKSKTAPHQINMKDDYSLIQSGALQMKKITYLTNWLKDKKSGYYIKIDPNFATSCEELSMFNSSN